MENQVKRTERDYKIKLEDMTLKQIRELKEGYQIRVGEALYAIQNEFMEKYDCGLPEVKVCTLVLASGIAQVEKEWTEYKINIKFSKEDD